MDLNHTLVTRRKIQRIVILIIILVTSLIIRLLMHYQFDKSALLYVGIPMTIAATLLWVAPHAPKKDWKRGYLRLVIWSLVIMLGSSAILFEGFLCIVMFMPIYFGVILIVFIFHYLAIRYKNRKSSQLFSHVLPLLLFISAFEGVTPEFSGNRDSQVTVSKIINGNIDAIKMKLIQPMDLQKDREWFLALFPMPYQVDAGSLNEGDIHKIYYTYHRWFITNTHSGSASLKIEKVKKNEIKTQFINDTSYLSNYLKLRGTKLQFIPVNEQQTRVTLTIYYERLLDPAWYFEPLQEYGVTKGAEFLLAEVVTPDAK
ncbi:hypothetical protein [Aliikangiella sp. IMCC44359]|uniref:hypothetical protein n=1 Tax=Aliikangiella sp. IMCC44359 TaxID=3459125 RepID=UPI00403ACAB0